MIKQVSSETTIPETALPEAASPPQLNWIIIAVMIAMHIGVVLAFFPPFFSWSAVGVFLVLHIITGSGVEIGWHRLASHRSFTCPKWVEYFFVFCGTFSGLSSPIDWAGTHRIHHAHSDKEGDYHNINKGFWWSHFIWILYHKPDIDEKVAKVTKDIKDDPFYQFCDRYLLVLHFGLAAILFALGGLPWVMWGSVVRVVLLWHGAWGVNSFAHAFGYRTYDTDDKSTNLWWLVPLTYGQGWHNNHHAFPYSARCGLKWWEIDPSWGVISLLHRVGLVTKVRLPNQS
ncbi:acyl-CoA desaturase [Roseofilum capinflatum]|uniref:Fatty acid desaturase n=1 Tax=Roseofilum capinflatum BLCC-M114 TaxID=3022440 RepID=A0ABT7B231_9CYAN|nr:fatty acid desaturase [Roseofilum capinflatum]MDJ1172882.1 fatty acid desaturase [Roseofilum capinflatum BLCC-M114]